MTGEVLTIGSNLSADAAISVVGWGGCAACEDATIRRRARAEPAAGAFDAMWRADVVWLWQEVLEVSSVDKDHAALAQDFWPDWSGTWLELVGTLSRLAPAPDAARSEERP